MSITRSSRASQGATFFFEQTQSFDAWELRWLLEYWQGLCDGPSCPRLIDVGLPAIARQAPKIIVRDAIDGGRDFINRFWGSELRIWLGFDGTGQRISEYFPQHARAAMLDSQRLALTSDLPVRRWGVTAYAQPNPATYEAIDLPLADDDGVRAHVLSMYVYRADGQGIQPDMAPLPGDTGNALSWSSRSRHSAES
ncbi:MAG: hypothetical protein RIG67_02685 [Rhodospirillales bacterium]